MISDKKKKYLKYNASRKELIDYIDILEYKLNILMITNNKNLENIRDMYKCITDIDNKKTKNIINNGDKRK